MEFNIAEYEKLIAKAKQIDPVNYLDIAHDFILYGGNLKTLNYEYKSVQQNDFPLKIAGTCNTCSRCNEIKPAASFRIYEGKFLGNVCRECRSNYSKKYAKERYANDPKYREKYKEYHKSYKKKHKN